MLLVLYDRGSEAVAQGPHPYRSTSFVFEKVTKKEKSQRNNSDHDQWRVLVIIIEVLTHVFRVNKQMLCVQFKEADVS